MKKYLQDYLFLFPISGVIVLLDQWTKSLVENSLVVGEIYRPDLWISEYVRIVHVTNYGAAFGIFQDLSTIFAILAAMVSLMIIYYFPHTPREDVIIRLAMALLLGGALGNLVDRIRQGHVTDFMSVGSFPVFNVADASVSVGVAVLFLGMWLQDRKKARELAELGRTESVPGSDEVSQE